MKTNLTMPIILLAALLLSQVGYSATAPVPEMVWIPPGTYLMGGPVFPDGSSFGFPATTVSISQGFWLGRYEVTQSEYLALMGNNPSWFNGVRPAFDESCQCLKDTDYGYNARRPVEQISWQDATNYCYRLTQQESKANRLPEGFVYRLPTEAQWEYAARAGTTTVFHYRNTMRSWGDQMASVLRNAITAYLESSRGGTLADLRRFLLEPDFRNEFLTTITDPEIVYYWRKGFVQLAGNKSIGPILTRLETFLGPKPIRYMVSQPVNRLDFNQIMDSGKIFLAKLSQGLFGKENSYLLGSLLVSRFQQTAMSRQAQTVRKDYWLYADEFQNFITPSMAEILAGTRKYRLGLILAHQELRQLERDREVAGAVFNCCTRVVFRVGDEDARKLAEGFASFEARDLQNLNTGQAICRIERSDHDFNLTVPFPAEPDPIEAGRRRQEVITGSRRKFGTPRVEIELALRRTQEKPSARTQEDIGGPSDAAPPSRPPQPTATHTPSLPKPSSVPQPSVPPKVSEVRKPVEEPVVAHERAPARDLGRGGALHKSIQERLQAEAHSLGFLAEIESQLRGKSMQAADLVLRRGELAIAVEIAVTTTIDHEFGNVKKCLDAGFKRVAVVSPKPDRLEQIAAAVRAGLVAESAAKASFHTPDEFIAELRKLVETAAPAPPTPNERTTRGFKVRRHGPTLTPEERKAKEEIAMQMMTEAMKKKTSIA